MQKVLAKNTTADDYNDYIVFSEYNPDTGEYDARCGLPEIRQIYTMPDDPLTEYDDAACCEYLTGGITQHDVYGDPTYTWANDYSTCTGHVDGTCYNCKQPVTVEETVDDIYQNRTHSSDKASTCEIHGSKYHETEEFNNLLFAKQMKYEDLPLAPHTPGDWIIDIPATCISIGQKHRECEYCGTTIEIESTPLAPHESGDWIVDTPATCTTTGSKHKACEYCGIITETETIPVTEHIFKLPSYEWNEDKSQCTATRQCKNCSYKETETVNSTSVITHAATCLLDGLKTFTANFISTFFTQQETTETLNKLGHEWDTGTVTTEPTCEDTGVKTYVCNHDASHTRTEVIPVLGHDWDEGTVTTEPTCENAGVRTFTCKNNPDHTRTEIIPELGHDWDEGVVTTQPTCTEEGTLTYTCKHDSSHTRTEAIPKLNHSYSSWTVTKEPTCDETGVKTYVCAHDESHTYTEIIPVLGHDWDEGVVTEEPTCTKEGILTYTCKHDSNHTRTETIPKSNHSYGEWTVVTEPTCTEDGSEERVCQGCDHSETRVVKSLGHNPTVVIENRVEPTETEKGSYDEVTVCDRCNEELSREKVTIPELGKPSDNDDSNNNDDSDDTDNNVPFPTDNNSDDNTDDNVFPPIKEEKPVEETIVEELPALNEFSENDDTPTKDEPTVIPEEEPKATNEHNIKKVAVVATSVGLTGSGTFAFLFFIWWRRRKVKGHIYSDGQVYRVELSGKDFLFVDTYDEFEFKNLKEDVYELKIYDADENLVLSSEIYTKAKNEEDLMNVIQSEFQSFEYDQKGKTLNISFFK